MLAKSQNLKVDTAVYDLEDSVAPNQKVEARYALRKFLQSGRPPGVKEVAVRINAIDTGLALDDLRAVVSAASPYAYVIVATSSVDNCPH
jgi:citrate lyase subunit beta-like protein